MEHREKILAELKEIAPHLSGIEPSMPYDVPGEYFELLPFTMLSRVAGPVDQPGVPEGYFESLPGVMLARVKGTEITEELVAVAPALNRVDKQMPFHVPAGYFDNLGATPPRETQAPVVPINSSRKKWIWAVAVCVVGLLGMFAWQNLWYEPIEGTSTPAIATTTVDSSAMLELASALAAIPDTALQTELRSSNTHEEFASALYYITTDNFETALKDFTDEEIKAQLAFTGGKS